MAKMKLALIGRVFGRLTVIESAGTDKKYKTSLWKCVCSCDGTTVVSGKALMRGGTRSCGCLRKEVSSHATHRQTNTPEYVVWKGMKARCLNPKHKSWKEYGENGVTVCKRWLNSFEAFISDLGKRPSPKHSLGRVLDRGNYEPENTFWMTLAEQALSRKNNNLSLIHI